MHVLYLFMDRCEYRELFYTAPGLGRHISGAILYKETLVQRSSSGAAFVDCLTSQGILAGIKVDEVWKQVWCAKCGYIIWRAWRMCMRGCAQPCRSVCHLHFKLVVATRFRCCWMPNRWHYVTGPGAVPRIANRDVHPWFGQPGSQLLYLLAVSSCHCHFGSRVAPVISQSVVRLHLTSHIQLPLLSLLSWSTDAL